jgi:hypothetical protein
MTKEEAIDLIYNGNLITCTKDEYVKIRPALQNKAGELIDLGDHMRAIIMIEEVKRLDLLFPPLKF